MSKHINTHLFFHMNDSGGSKQKDSSGSSSTTRKPKKASSNLFSGYEIDTNPPLPSESGDYYDYYTNYGIPDYYGPTSPTSPPYAYGEDPYQYQYEYRNNEYDYYNHSNAPDYSDNYASGGGGGGERSYGSDRPYRDNFAAQHATNHSDAQLMSQPSTSGYSHHPSYLQPPLVSPPVQDPKRASPTSPFAGDLWPTSYSNDPQGLGAVAHKLHRITFVEACIFQPPDLPSPVRHGGPVPPVQGHHAPVPPPVRPPLPVLAQGERSPTSTGGTQYYQEWTSKHMRHLCSRFEKPAQQQLLMNVERKSKYPFIILCTPVTHSSSLSKSSSNSSSNKPRAYHREISHLSAYSLEEEEEEDEEENWITQKQRDSINSHYLPPPPPPLLMPHIWPEIRYIDGLYTVCATIVRPGSGVPSEIEALSELGLVDQSGYGATMHDNPYNHHHSQQRHEKHISFQDSQSAGSGGEVNPRPAGYIVSAFATFPGEDSERLEKNWLLWTGARILYKYLPMCVGLRRLIFLKRCPDMYRDDLALQNKVKPTIFTGFTYVLLCECFNLQDAYIASVCTTIDQLRARCCGYSALYLTHYQQQQPGGGQPVRPLPTQMEQSSNMNRHVASTSTGATSHHHHHHVQPRHHRSTQDFTEFDNER